MPVPSNSPFAVFIKARASGACFPLSFIVSSPHIVECTDADKDPACRTNPFLPPATHDAALAADAQTHSDPASSSQSADSRRTTSGPAPRTPALARPGRPGRPRRRSGLDRRGPRHPLGSLRGQHADHDRPANRRTAASRTPSAASRGTSCAASRGTRSSSPGGVSGDRLLPVHRRHVQRCLGECLGGCCLEVAPAGVDPVLYVLVPLLSVLDGLNQAFELVGVVRHDHFQAAAVLVLLDDPLDPLPHRGVSGRNLVGGDLLVARRVEVAPTDVRNVADPGLLRVVEGAQQRNLRRIRASIRASTGPITAVRNECSAIVSGSLTPAIHQPERFARLSMPISSRNPAVPLAWSVSSAMWCLRSLTCRTRLERNARR